MARRLRGVPVTVALTCCVAAWAQPEVAPVDAGECELELAAARSRATGEPAAHEESARLACGVGTGSELALALGRERGAGDPRVRALALEGKTTLDPLNRRWPGVTWVLAGGVAWQREAGQGWRGSDAFVQIELARRLAPRAAGDERGAWWLEATLGHGRDLADRRRRTVWSAAVERGFGEAYAVVVELDGDDREPPTAAFVVKRELGEDVELELALRRTLGSTRERGVELKLVFGF